MTRKKNAEERCLAPLQLRLFRLREMAPRLLLADTHPDALTTPEREFLAVALSRTGDGFDANVAFGVKARRGERKSPKEAQKSDHIRFAMSFIAKITTTETNKYLMRPGVGLDDAIAAAAERFKLGEETLRTYWFNHPELHSPSFDRPITSLP
jgi:hypothetical protein